MRFLIIMGILIVAFNIILWHEVNISVDFIHECREELQNLKNEGIPPKNLLKEYEKDGIIFYNEFVFPIRIYYFDYFPSSSCVSQVFTEKTLTSVRINSWSLIIDELGVNLSSKENESNNSFQSDVSIENNPIEFKVYKEKIGKYFRWWPSGVGVKIYKFLPDNITNQKDLKIFKKIKEVKLIVDYEYEYDGEKKLVTVTSVYKPRVRISSAFWDKWMSV